jgi:hypothetical protein
MKLLNTLAVLALSLLTAQPSAQATVAIYSGTEQQLQIDAFEGQGSGNANGVRRFTGRIYFLYELETGRSVEIRIQGAVYKVRTERNLQRVFFHRALNLNSVLAQTFLSDGNRTNQPGVTAVSMVSWEGSATFSGPGPDIEAATGLPRGFPRAVTSRQQLTTRVTSFDGGNFLVRRNDVASLIVAMTKASNTASETFDAALQRVKNTLNAQGKTEVQSLTSLD